MILPAPDKEFSMNNNVTAKLSEQEVKQRARAKVVNVLRDLGAYHAMPMAEQKSIYTSLVQEYMDEEREKLGLTGNGKNRTGLARPMATDSGADMGYKGYDPGFTGDTRSFKELVDSVDFPK